jgi:hypothetical protein
MVDIHPHGGPFSPPYTQPYFTADPEEQGKGTTSAGRLLGTIQRALIAARVPATDLFHVLSGLS